MPAEKPETFILLPTHGTTTVATYSTAAQRKFFTEIDGARTATAARRIGRSVGLGAKPNFRILDSIHENGVKLVEMTPSTAKDVLAAAPGTRIVPVVYYSPAVFRREVMTAATAGTGAAVKTTITVVSKVDGTTPVRGAEVVAFTDFDAEEGDQGRTNSAGQVKLKLGSPESIERIFVYPESGYWGVAKKNVATDEDITIKLTPVDLGLTDGLRYMYGNTALDVGTGVTVGVIDTGVADHPDLVIHGGRNTVLGESPNDYGSNGNSHGTHVAGIIAARGTTPSGLRGVAPGVKLRSYRVYGKGKAKAQNYAIVKAIDQAVDDKCDIINLSLTGVSDDATLSAIHVARQKGCLVVAAAGNEHRKAVQYPAADPLCIAVSAIGRKGTFPTGTDAEDDVAAPYGTDPDDFVAAFSNIGLQVDVCGPGVGILSTVPNGYAAMGGTSMACPAVAGIAARILASRTDIRGMSRSQERSDLLAGALLTAAKDLGFQAKFQGNGCPS